MSKKKVLVMGRFSSGKSTLINALVWDTVMKTGIPPTTALPTCISYATEASNEVWFQDGRKTQTDDQMLKLLESMAEKELPNGIPEDAPCVHKYRPHPHPGITWIDTPGIVDNDCRAHLHTFQPDAVIYTMNAGMGFLAGVADDLSCLFRQYGHNRVWIALTWWDRLSEEDRSIVLHRVREQLPRFIPHVSPDYVSSWLAEHIIPLDARNAFLFRTGQEFTLTPAGEGIEQLERRLLTALG